MPGLRPPPRRPPVSEKLTVTQRSVLGAVAKRRPVAGNDGGWVSLHDVRRPTVHSLQRLGLIEGRLTGAYTVGSQTYRLTPAGRLALEKSGGER